MLNGYQRGNGVKKSPKIPPKITPSQKHSDLFNKLYLNGIKTKKKNGGRFLLISHQKYCRFMRILSFVTEIAFCVIIFGNCIFAVYCGWYEPKFFVYN